MSLRRCASDYASAAAAAMPMMPRYSPIADDTPYDHAMMRDFAADAPPPP